MPLRKIFQTLNDDSHTYSHNPQHTLVICIAERAATLGDDSPFQRYKIVATTTSTSTTTAKRNDGGKEPFQGKFIMWIGIFIGNMRPSTLLACGFHFFFFFVILFPSVCSFFSLAFKCPFHFLFGCRSPNLCHSVSSLRLFKEKNMRPFSLTGYYYFIQQAIHPIRKRKTCIDLCEMRRPGQAKARGERETQKGIIFTLISTIGDCCLGHRMLNQDPTKHALVSVYSHFFHTSALNARITHHTKY